MSWYGYLAHPAFFFASWKGHPPFGIAATLLLLLSLAWGFAEAEFVVLRGTRKRRTTLTPDWGFLLAPPLVMHILWIGSAFVTLGILRLLHNNALFETVFSVLVIGGIPCIIDWISCIVSGVSYIAFICWQAASFLVLFWTTWLLWTGLHTACHLSSWQAVLAVLPLLIPLWIITALMALKRPPETFQSCHSWRRACGEKVIVFYSGRKERHELEAIVKGADNALQQVLNLLDLKPLKFKVSVFLCQDEQQHRKLVKGKRDEAAPMAGGYAHHDSISLVYGKWCDIGRIVSHEFCHVIRRHRVTLELLGILDEGLSTYVTDKLHPGSTPPAIALGPNLQVVANTSVFYEWTHTQKPALHGFYCYRHAHALADYLISRYGLPRYFELCRDVSASKEPTEGTRLAAGMEKVYGMPMTQLEKSWRTTWPGTWTTGQTELDLE